MSVLDWFKNRPSLFEPDHVSDEMTLRAIDKAVSLTNPRIKLIDSYQDRLAPAVETSIRYLRERVLAVPPAIRVSSLCWAVDPALRAFFVSARDIPHAIGRSTNLRTLFDKYKEIDQAYFVLAMQFKEQRVLGISMRGDFVQHDVAQTTVSFYEHEARICGLDDSEVRRLLGLQAYEYLLAQALIEIGEERTERRDLESNRALIQARLRLLQQQGPGLGSVFGNVPARSDDESKLSAELMENERQLEALGRPQSTLDTELESLHAVLMHPERYIQIEQKQLRLNNMNVLVDDQSTDVASDVAFSLVRLNGVPQRQRAFVLASFSRAELPEARLNFDIAERLL